MKTNQNLHPVVLISATLVSFFGLFVIFYG
jgi:hypothetical protein